MLVYRSSWFRQLPCNGIHYHCCENGMNYGRSCYSQLWLIYGLSMVNLNGNQDSYGIHCHKSSSHRWENSHNFNGHGFNSYGHHPMNPMGDLEIKDGNPDSKSGFFQSRFGWMIFKFSQKKTTPWIHNFAKICSHWYRLDSLSCLGCMIHFWFTLIEFSFTFRWFPLTFRFLPVSHGLETDEQMREWWGDVIITVCN